MADRERDVLLRVAKFHFVTAEQLEEFLFSDRTDLKQSSCRVMTRQVLSSLQKQGFITRTPRAIGGPEAGSTRSAYFITRAGMRLVWEAGAGMEPKRTVPRGTFLQRHALALGDAALSFERSARRNDGHALIVWETDWEAAQRGDRHIVVPDAYAIYVTREDEIHAFVEMDLGTQGSRYFQKKIERYLELYRSETWKARLPLWPSVLTVVPTETRSSLLRAATERVIAAQFDSGRIERGTDFAFCDLPTLVRDGPLAPIWRRVGSREARPLLDGD